MPSAPRALRGGTVRLTFSGSIITAPMPMPSLKAKGGASSPSKGSWIYETFQQRRLIGAAHPSLNSAKRSCVPPPISGQIAPPGAPPSPSRRLCPLNPLLPIGRAALLFSIPHTRPTSPRPRELERPCPRNIRSFSAAWDCGQLTKKKIAQMPSWSSHPHLISSSGSLKPIQLANSPARWPSTTPLSSDQAKTLLVPCALSDPADSRQPS